MAPDNANRLQVIQMLLLLHGDKEWAYIALRSILRQGMLALKT